ncbi:ABC1 kinase family protein [Aerococcus urinae]|uniref:ABC1 kinase family protein n=1 Tax=Aerococcus urinae TaxID=1376 RepID=UPI00227AB203|nr:AarF/UbiB family protein [Aerococcus urinae]MCY3049938.1 AarF/UbiB family protein [Aerococcus urinae]
MASSTHRLSEIIQVLANFGFGEVYQRSFKKLDIQESAKNLRQAFEALGPSFIKIGQILSTRNDLLSEPYILELQKLQHSAPPFPYQEAEQIIREELGENPEQCFAAFDKKALATGSIAQIHRAQLQSGQEVVVKIQRPQIKEQLISDIDLFIHVINKIPTIFTNIISDPVAILQEIRQQSLLEMDFLNEANNMRRFQNNHEKRSLICVPTYYEELTTHKVLVMDYIEGDSIGNVTKLKELGYDLNNIAEKLVYSFLCQVFEDGFYHADPHPGNILISQEKIYFIDLGMMGSLSSSDQKLLINLLEALAFKDIDELVRLLQIICKGPRITDQYSLYKDVQWLFDRYLTTGLEAIDIGEIFQEVMKTALKYKLTFPTKFVQLSKTVIILEGICESLNPEFDFMSIFMDFTFHHSLLEQSRLLNKDHLLRESTRLLRSGISLPQQANQALSEFIKGRTTINISMREIKKLTKELNQIINRIVTALILSAIIISSGFIVSQNNSHYAGNIALLFFVMGVVLGLYLLYSFVRSRKK